MPKRPDGSFVLSEIGDLLDGGHDLWSFCDTCQGSRRLDLEALAKRYGRHLRIAAVVSRLRCSTCRDAGRRQAVSIRIIWGRGEFSYPDFSGSTEDQD